MEDRAAARQLTKSEYVSAVVECESRAAEQTRAFYIRVFLPWAREQGMPTHPNNWFLGVRSDSCDSLMLADFPVGTPYWRSYELQYDLIAVHRLLEEGQCQKALDMLTALGKQPEAAEERATIERWTGYCLIALRKPALAADAYDTAVRLDPSDAEAVYGRGLANCCMGELDKGVADFTEAIRLDPKYSEAYYRRGLVYAKIGEKTKAEADSAQAKRLGYDPK